MLSLLLFSLFREELAARIRGCSLEIRVDGGRLGIFMYADDILLPENERMLQELMNVANE